MELGEPDEMGRRKPIPTGAFVELDCDTVIYALGTDADPVVAGTAPAPVRNSWCHVVADDQSQATMMSKVFAGAPRCS